MPRALSHAVVLTDDLDVTLQFLGEIAKVAPVSPVTDGAPEDYSLVFGWPLEQAATRYADALRGLKRVTDEANDYYEMEDYRDDGFARGKQLHPGLMQAWGEFEVASDALTAEVTALKQGLIERDLALSPHVSDARPPRVWISGARESLNLKASAWLRRSADRREAQRDLLLSVRARLRLPHPSPREQGTGELRTV